MEGVKIISRPKNENNKQKQEVENFIGTSISLGQGFVKINDVCVTSNPFYKVTTIPILGDKKQTYIEGLPPIKKLGIKGRYFSFIQIESALKGEIYDEIFSNFYLKDKNTLIMQKYGYYIEMKRTDILSEDPDDYTIP